MRMMAANRSFEKELVGLDRLRMIGFCKSQYTSSMAKQGVLEVAGWVRCLQIWIHEIERQSWTYFDVTSDSTALS